MATTCTHCLAVMPSDLAICPACGRSAPPRPALSRFVPSGSSPVRSVGTLLRPVAATARNIPAALSYLVLPAIAFFFVEPYRRSAFVRFHAIQSLLFPVAVAILLGLSLLVATVSAIVGWLLLILVSDACVVMLVVLALKAYRGEAFRLPLLGDLAAQQAGLE